jgi:CRISPR-associated endonuclease Cas3-HD
LSAAARAVWAKHDRKTDDWLPLWRHLADSAAVAGMLWDEWLPDSVRAVLADAVTGGVEDARRLVIWLAATHDIGKATPAFACQVESLAQRMRDAGLDMPSFRQFLDRRLAPHGLAGQALLQQWLMERCGWSRSMTLQWAIVAGGHHGVPPAIGDIKELNVHPELLRTPGCEAAWRGVQFEFLDACADACRVIDRMPAWREVKLSQPAQVLLTGLIIVADWIASNADLFPYFPQAERQGDRERVEAAWRGLGLPRQWEAIEPPDDPAALITSRFALPPGARVRPVQRCAVELARSMPVPGLMVIEAPMGEGKTEAALAVAEIFAARSGAGGCLVALPTMATGNAMFPRLMDWLDRLPDVRGEPGPRSVLLAHSKAALNDDFAGLMRAGRRVSAVDAGGDGDERGHRGDRRVLSAGVGGASVVAGEEEGAVVLIRGRHDRPVAVHGIEESSSGTAAPRARRQGRDHR